MLIITEQDEQWLKQHLKILKMYYRQQARIYRGNPIGKAHDDCLQHLTDMLNRMEDKPDEKN